MRTRIELTSAFLASARQQFVQNMTGVALEEALAAAGGHRSVLGLAKHAAAWSHVYHSYAFDPAPKHWVAIDWPRGLRDTIDASQAYLDELLTWANASFDAWEQSLRALADEELDAPHRCHWGATMPLFDIVVLVANHWTFHTGEINEVLSIARGEAWEYSEEVEENHISTAGHRMRAQWMNEQQVAAYEAYIAKRDAQLHPNA
jgi:uncharacterized damage-inducible protein DinB